MTKIEIIDETIEFYKNNPRSKGSKNKCVYLNNKGDKCAFSRCCTDEGVTWLHEEVDNKLNGASVREEYLKHLIPKYQGHEYKFWKEIQELHDINGYWDDGKLSVIGVSFVNLLKYKYK